MYMARHEGPDAGRAATLLGRLKYCPTFPDPSSPRREPHSSARDASEEDSANSLARITIRPI